METETTVEQIIVSTLKELREEYSHLNEYGQHNMLVWIGERFIAKNGFWFDTIISALELQDKERKNERNT